MKLHSDHETKKKAFYGSIDRLIDRVRQFQETNKERIALVDSTLAQLVYIGPSS